MGIVLPVELRSNKDDVSKKDASKGITLPLPKSTSIPRESSPGKQAIAGLFDLGTDLPGLAGLIGAAGEAGYDYITDDDEDKLYSRKFAEAAKEGWDADFIQKSQEWRDNTNELLGISEPILMEDQLARNAALFLPIPGLAAIKAAGMLGRLSKIGAGAANVVLPTVKKGPLPNMLLRGGIQGGIGVGIDQGVRALLDDPQNHPLLFSERALTGEDAPREPSVSDAEVDFDPDAPLTTDQALKLIEQNDIKDRVRMSGIVLPEELRRPQKPTGITLPAELEEPSKEDSVVRNRLEMDEKMQKEKDWEEIRNIGIIAGGVLGGQYLVRRHLGKLATETDADVASPQEHLKSALDRDTPKTSVGKTAYASVLDKSREINNAFAEMDASDAIRKWSDDTFITDINGIASDVTINGRFDARFAPGKGEHSISELEADRLALRTAGKDEIFQDAMKARSELAATKDVYDKSGNILFAASGPSTWRANLTDKDLMKRVEAGLDGGPIEALMKKYADNFESILDYEVHTQLITREAADALKGRFGDAYMPFIGKSKKNFLGRLGAKLGGNSKYGDELNTASLYHARKGGGAHDILNVNAAHNMYKFKSIQHAKDQLYKHTILSNAAGIQYRAGSKGYQRQRIVEEVDPKTGNTTRKTVSDESVTPLLHDESGRGTHLLAVGDIDAGVNPDAVPMRVVSDLKNIKDPETRIRAQREFRRNALEEGSEVTQKHLQGMDYNKEIIFVQHKSKLYAYRVPDPGIRAAIDVHPKLHWSLETNRYFKNLFTKFTTGEYSLFAPMSFLYSAQTVAQTTGGLREGWKSYGRSLGGSRDIFMDQAAGILADYVAKKVAKGATVNAGSVGELNKLQQYLHNRYSNIFLGYIRREGGKISTGLGSTIDNTDAILDQFGKEFTDHYGALEMGAVRRMWKAFNYAANEGPAYAVMKASMKNGFEELDELERIKKTRKAIEQGKLQAGDVTRVGSSQAARVVHATIPFSSPMLQTFNAIGHSAKNDFPAFVTGVGSLIGIPTLTELTYNAGISKSGMTFKDREGKEWTYDDYYWNGFTTEQRNNNFILFVPGRPPWEASLMPLAPEFGLFKAVVTETADLLFGLSDVGNIGRTQRGGANDVGRDHFLAALERLLDVPVPPLAGALMSGVGLDPRVGFNLSPGDPEDPGAEWDFIKVHGIGSGERVSPGLGAKRDVGDYADRKVAAMASDILGAGGASVIAFTDGLMAGTKNEGLSQGVVQGLSGVIDSGVRQARYLQPITSLFAGRSISPGASGEIATALYNKKSSLRSLTKDAKILMGGVGYVKVDGKDIPIDTIVPTQDPIRKTLAADASTLTSTINNLDSEIGNLRKELSKIENSSLFSLKDKKDIKAGKQLRIQTLKSMQLGHLVTYENTISNMLSKEFDRDIRVNLSGRGLGAVIGARPNVD